MPVIPRHRVAIIALVVLALLAPLATVAHTQEASHLEVNSARYLVMDRETGEVFAQRGAQDRVPVASITKIFTAIEALETASLDMPIVIDDSDIFDANSTRMGFSPGQTYTLRDLLYGMMLPSGNDAAHAIARSLGAEEGDTAEQAVERFMSQVNQRSEDLGLQDTNLKNPHGLEEDDHYSTAWDVAAFMQYAMQNPDFVTIIGTTSYTTSNELLTVSNTNRLLNSYGPLVGGKTGYETNAGWCLVTAAEVDGRQMIAVTLDGIAPDDWYDDNRVLLDYGFAEKSELIASDAPFEGDIISHSDPAIAELTRNAQPGVALHAAAPDVSAPSEDAATLEQEPDPAQASDGLTDARIWLVAGAVLGVVAVRTLFTFRAPRA